MNGDEASSTRSSSPLPVSMGPDNEIYSFSPSLSISPPPSPSTNLYPLHSHEFPLLKSLSAPSSFSMERFQPTDNPNYQSSCLKELKETSSTDNKENGWSGFCLDAAIVVGGTTVLHPNYIKVSLFLCFL
ncbi:hypothetical protein KSS87_007587 [Heliosperma pusillum]|nr:hypothetical protein KSS87_007587 [Heliosperma pusillum]